MDEILIRRLDRRDKSFLKSQTDSTGQLHGFYYSLQVHTNITQVQREYRLECALDALGNSLLFHMKSHDFLCTYSESDWNGWDVAIRFRLKINPNSESFARWLLNVQDVWTADGKTICSTSLENYINSNAGGILEPYVHSCMEEVGAELLAAHGALSWPDRTVSRLGVDWLSVVAAEEVQLTPREKTVQRVQIAPGTLLCNQYLLEKRLGAGGMGQVWKAEDMLLDKPVAIKVLAENCSDDLRETIKEEAIILGRLSDPNIANMRGYHEDGNVSFMVMDFVDGCSLEDIICRKGKLTEDETRRWLEPVASAIDALHKIGIVHRDIKPANIMIGRISPTDSTDRAFLCDFGIASQNRNVTMNAWGTEYYRAPEIEPGVGVTPAADVYSFAVTIYRCLTGVHAGRIREGSPVTNVFPSAQRGLCWNHSERPAKCAELFAKPIPVETSRPVYSPANGIVLPIKVIDELIYMLGRLQKQDNVKQLNSLGKVMFVKDERTGWKVADTKAFVDFLSSLQLGSLGDMKEANAEDRRQQIVCWFVNHNIDEEFDAATCAVLRAIHASVATPFQENMQ